MDKRTIVQRSLKALSAALVLLGTLSLTTCDLFKTGFGDKVDITPPAVAIGSPAQNAYMRGEITLTGTASDDLSITQVTIRYTGTGGSPQSKTATVTNGAWSTTIPTGTAQADNLPDGEQQITVAAVDGSGKETDAVLLVYVDNIAPTVLITVPQGYALNRPTASDYVDIKGEVWDRSPITRVDVGVYDGLTLMETKQADGTNTWSTRVDISPVAYSNTHAFTYSVEATDRAGNKNTYYYHSQDIWANLPLNTLFPATDQIGLVDQTHSGTVIGLDYAALYALRTGYTGGTYADFYKDNDATKPEIHFSNLDDSLPLTSNVIATKAPVTGYINPGAAGNMVNGGSLEAFIIPWTASVPPATPANVNPADIIWNPIGTSINYQIKTKVGGVDLPSGRYVVGIRVGAVGTTSTSEQYRQFILDSGAPSIDQVTPVEESLVNRVTFAAGTPCAGQTGIELRAHATDDNGVSTFTAVASLTEGGAALPGIGVAADAGAPGWYWVHMPLAAGNTTIWFELQASDDVGTVAHRTVHYTIDETAPTVAITTPGAGGWVTGNSTTIAGTASDAGGQLESIYVWLGLTTDTPPADVTTWKDDAQNRGKTLTGNASWITTLPLCNGSGVVTEGQYTAHVVAQDSAGNLSTQATRSFYLDQANPTLTETSIGSVQVYRNAVFSLSGNAADTSALSNITITQSYNGAPATTVLNQALSGTSQAWSWNFPGGGDGTYVYTITVTDTAGKAAPMLSRTVVYDTVLPAITITSLAPVIGTNTVNGIVTLHAAISDETSLDTVWYRYGDSGAFTQITVNPTTPTLILDTTNAAVFPDAATTNVWLRAVDLAGNTRDTSTALAVDQSSDRPVLTLSNMDAANDTLPEAAGNLQETNAKVQGTITDDDSVNAATIEISIDSASAWAAVSQHGVNGQTVNFEHNLTTLSPEGAHYFHVRASDLASAKSGRPAISWSIGPVYFVIDKNPPSLTVTSPASGSLHSANFTINGTASDANGLTGNIVTIRNGGTVVATPAVASGSWDYNVTIADVSIPEGTVSWTVETTDTFGKTTVVPFSFLKDTIAPTVSITTPVNGTWNTGATLSAIGTASDANGIVSVEYSTNGTTWNAASGTTSWTVLLNLITLGESTAATGPGSKTLSIRATDAAGFTCTPVTSSFGVDQTTPDTTETGIGAASASRRALFTLAGTATDTNALSSLLVEQRMNAGSWVTVYSNLALSGVSQAWTLGATLPRNPAIPANPLLQDGTFDYRITVMDVAGNAKVVNRTVLVDQTAPTAAIVDPAADAVMMGSAYSVNGTATDVGGAGVATVYWWVGNFGDTAPASLSSWNVATGTTSWNALLNLTTIGEGRRTLHIKAVDTATNEMATAATVNFYIDQAPPTLTISSPADGSVYSAGFTMNGTAADTNLSTVRVRINAGGWNTATGTTAWSYDVAIGSLNVGVNTITVEASDIAGRTTTQSIDVSRDTAAPTFTFTNCESDGSSVLMESSPKIVGSVADASGTANIESYIESWSYATSSWSLVEGWTSLGATGNAKVFNWQKDLSNGVTFPEGRYRITLRASDIASPTTNSTSGVPGTVGESVIFRLDRNNPTVALTAPSQGSFQRTDFSVTGTSSDLNTIASVRVKVDSSDFSGGYVTAGTGNGFATWTATVGTGTLTAGTHTIYVQATDGTGRTTLLSRDFTFDNVGPSISVLTPLSATTVNGAVTVKGTSSDTNSVASMEIRIGKDLVWNALSSVYSWEYAFTNIDTYANLTFADEVSPGVWRLYIHLRATDSANNTATIDTYYLDLDPAMDTPIATIYQPLDNQTVGGSTRVYGIATDDDAVYRVEMQIDLNNDGVFTGTSDYWNYSGIGTPTMGPDGDTNDRFENEATWYPVTGTINWYQVINQFGEYNAPIPGDTRTIRVRVRAVDTKDGLNPGIPGNYQEIRITFDNTVPIIEDVQIDKDGVLGGADAVPYSTGLRVSGTFYIFAVVKDNGDIDQIDQIEQGPLTGTDRIDDDGTITTDLGTGYSPGYHSYRIRIPVNTLTLGSGVFFNTSGTYAVSIKATDNTSPNPYQTFSYLNIQVDNYYPSGAYTGNTTQVLGDQYKVQGTATDVGTGSGIVQGVNRIVGYFVKGTLVYNPKTGDTDTFTEVNMLPSLSAYWITIDKLTEVGVSDLLPNGDNDGYLESLTVSGNTYDWWAEVDTTNLPDGPMTFHYVVFDNAGNGTHYTQTLYVRNNAPVIDSIVLGTDINGANGDNDPGERVTFTAGYGATNFTVRNNYLTITVNASSGNVRNRYSIMYNGNQRNGTLTNNALTITDFITAPAMPDTTVNGAVFSIMVFDSTVSDDNDWNNVDADPNDDELTATLSLGMTLDNVDNTPPTINVASFGQKYTLPSPNRDSSKATMNVSDYNENIVMSGLVRQGHVEYATPPDLSGQVIFKGKAYDNQRIQRITAQITGYNGGAGLNTEFNIATWGTDGLTGLSSVTPYWAFTVNASSEAVTEADGHVLNWDFAWNSAAITNAATDGVSVTFRVYDYGTGGAGDSQITVDVVPYITQIANTTGGLSTDVIRSSTGKYSLDYNNDATPLTFTVTGFNLSGAAAYISPTAISTPGGTALTVNSTTATTAVIRRSFLRSGWLTLFVNNIPSGNNLNSNSAQSGTTYYNREKDPIIPVSEQWTDDRYIWMWQDTQVMSGTSNQTFYYPDMIMNGIQPIFSYCNDNDGYTYRTTGDGASVRRAGVWYERQTAIAYADGAYWILSTEDAFSAGNIGFLQLNRDVNANAAVGAADADFIELIGEDYNTRQLNRFRYPKLIAQTSTTNDADVYVVYYDAHPSERGLTFMSFRATGADATNLTNQATGDNTRAAPAVVLPGTAGGNCSQYYDMVKVNTTDIAVIYYDETAGTLKMQYSADAWGATNLTNTGATWTTVNVDASPMTGGHVSATSDGTYVYVAYYDAGEANLKFSRITWATKAVQTYVIDSYLSVGTWTNIQIFNGVPYITYYSDSYNGTKKSIRIAFPTDGAGGVSAANITTHGVLASGTSNAYSGTWEVMTIPTVSVPKGGMEQFNHTQLGSYISTLTTPNQTLPVVGWLGDRLEYAKMQPNN